MPSTTPESRAGSTPESQASYPLSTGCVAQAPISLGTASSQLSSSRSFASPVFHLSSFCTTIANFSCCRAIFPRGKIKDCNWKQGGAYPGGHNWGEYCDDCLKWHFYPLGSYSCSQETWNGVCHFLMQEELSIWLSSGWLWSAHDLLLSCAVWLQSFPSLSGRPAHLEELMLPSGDGPRLMSPLWLSVRCPLSSAVFCQMSPAFCNVSGFLLQSSWIFFQPNWVPAVSAPFILLER